MSYCLSRCGRHVADHSAATEPTAVIQSAWRNTESRFDLRDNGQALSPPWQSHIDGFYNFSPSVPEIGVFEH